jgi:DNA adenine methylase
MGSKARIAKHILPIMLKNRKEGQWWVEPFVGGANMIDKVEGNRLGADLNNYLISLLQHCEEGLSNDLPDKISEDEYNHIKNNFDKYEDHLIAHCGFNATFGAKWFGGYARARKGTGYDRDVVCGKNSLVKAMPLLKNVYFKCSAYFDLIIPKNSVIYCDPPYKGATKYKDGFCHDRFWDWCRAKAKAGHQVFVSEYNAPADFVCVWQKEIQSGLNTNSTKKGIEKLFVHESQVESDYHSLY